MSSALIIGCDGQDGWLLARFLKGKGYFIGGTSRNPSTKNTDLDEFVNLDLTSSSFLVLEEHIKTRQPEEVYYLSAHHISSQENESLSNQEIERSVAVNYLAFLKLLEICHKYSSNSRIVYTSSSLIFTGVENEFQNEGTFPQPRCLYSLNKVAAMQAAEMYREKYKIFVSVGIMYNHESIYRNDYFLSKRIVNQVKGFLAGDLAQITVGNLDSVTDWGYALDYVEALWHILQLQSPDNFIVSSGKGHTVWDWFSVLGEYLNIDISTNIRVDHTLVNRAKPTLIGDNSKLRKMGWNPRNSFREMVVKIYNNEL